MVRAGRLISVCAFFCAGFLFGEDQSIIRKKPQHLGERAIVLEFSTDPSGQPTDLRIASSEAWTLENWAVALVKSGHVKPGSPGVKAIGENRYCATVAFPVENDGNPLSTDSTLPVPRIQPAPAYPFKLRQQRITGGALFQLTINEKAKVSKISLLKASHKEFGEQATQAVKLWRFSKPGTVHGKPVEMTINVMVTFELEGQPLVPWGWCVAPEPCLDTYLITGVTLPST